ncbi:jerky protein homolog-like [Euwallacea similis]|uniref:jerky protein homolog-like n=1 Tax=Euwallacea similis TaxID=1736056 RepID=UPI00344CE372
MSLSKRTHLKLQQKAEILELLQRGVVPTQLSRKYGVAKSTITSIKNKKRKILQSVGSTFTGPGKRKTLKMSVYAEMEKHLYKWFLKQREQHSPINGDMIKEKAKSLNSKFYRRSFQASNGWLQNFKKRYGIRFLKITGEKLSSPPELIAPFKQKLSEKIAKLQLGLEQIYSADESGLYWKLLPDKTYVSSMEKTAPGRKTEKQRITFLTCANASGNHKNFLETQGLPIRALLLLDNAPSHPPAEELNKIDKCVTVMYMPPNVTPLIQPMDQNAIRLTKLFYRKNLLSQVVAKGNVGETLKAVTLRDAVSNLNLAWEKLKPIVIKKCWHQILRQNIHFEEEEEEEENIPLSVLKLRIRDEDPEYAQPEIMKILSVLDPNAYDQNDVTVWNEDWQLENYRDEPENEQSDIIEVEDEDSNTVPDLFMSEKLISTCEALKCLNKVIQWTEENSDKIEYSTVVVLQDLRGNLVKTMCNKPTKQSKLTDFFHSTN